MPKQTQPDFAFPAKVEKDASSRLKSALASHNERDMLRALIDLTLAHSVVSPDTLLPSYKRIDSIAARTSPGVTLAMLRLLQATMLKNAYQANRWKYDRRDTPLQPIPDDYTEWSSNQFRYMTDSLCRLALCNPEILSATPISAMKGVITLNRETSIVYPTMLDFVANSCIAIRTSLLPDEFLPASILSSSNPVNTIHTTRPYLASVISIFNLISSSHTEGSIPYVCNEAKKINFISSRVYPSSYQEARQKQTELLYALYKSCGNSAAAPYALYEFTTASELPNPVGSENTAQLASELKHTIAENPSFYAVNCLKNTLNELLQGSADLTAPMSVVPGDEFEVQLSLCNLNSVRLTLYRVNTSPFTTDHYYSHEKGTPLPVAISSREIILKKHIPFQTDTTLSFKLPSPGHYIIVPAIDKANGIADRSYPMINATHFALATMTFTERNAIVVDQSTGRPVENADIRLLPTARNAALRSLTSTDSNGIACIDSSLQGNLFVSKENDSYASPQYIYRLNSSVKQDGAALAAFTDLPIYHPGDSVEWLAVAYTFNGKIRQSAEGVRLKAVIHDANNQSVDTLIASTDAFGRITGKFRLPEGGLTGQYHISFNSDNATDPSIRGEVWFTVSDYKLPTFSVEIPTVEQGTPAGGVTLRGKAETYAGMPVAGAKVTVSVKSIPFFARFFSGGQAFYSTETSTDADGSFSIALTADVIALSPDPKGVFAADVSVTSSAQESRQTTRIFALAKRYLLGASPASDIDASKPVDFHIRVTDPEGKDINALVGYSLIDTDGKTAVEGECSTSSTGVDLSEVKSGIYTLSLTYPGADTLSIDNIALYRLTDPLPPRDLPVWIPQTSFTGKQAKVVYGTYSPDTYVLATIWNENEIISRRWLKCEPGIHIFDLAVTDGQEKANLNLFATKNYRTTSMDITLTDKAAIPGITIESSTFRNRLVPGSTESWTLTVKAKDGSPASAALVLDVYNQALRQLAKADWNLHLMSGSAKHLSVITPPLEQIIHSGVNKPFEYLRCNLLSIPEFDTYGLAFGPNGRYRVRGMLATRSAGVIMKKASTNSLITKEESADADLFAVSEHSDMVAPMMAEADAGATAEETSAESKVTATETPAYRSGETPLALFRPMLTTDSEGKVTCRFTVPDANTTWCFNALAFTRNMLSSSFATEVTAAKKIMVTPNPPRFVRTGDSVEIAATVFNNTETPFTATTIIETFNPSTGRILTSDTITSDLILPAASSVVSAEIDAPYDAPFIGFRVRSSADGHSDGEQIIIPVLPSSSPVIESKPFYLAPDQHTYETTLPDVEVGRQLTLTYCDNPLWYVVTALPGLRTPSRETSIDAAASLFSTAVAAELIKAQPILEEALTEWQHAADKDSMLTSLLSRNADMKNMLLEATPWMVDAQTDSERMARLALLFDKNEIKTATLKALSILSRLEQPEGGWSWSAASSRMSEWTTLSVLYTLGRLNSLGMLPDNNSLLAMSLRAFRRLETKDAERLRKNPQGSFLEFTRLSALWPQFALTADGTKVKTAGINYILKNWKKMQVRDKAISAMILHNSNYRSVAAKIMESVSEYSTYSPQKGMWWPSVTDTYGYYETLTTAATAARAYAMISPDAPDTDRIRQWLIIQKEAMDWGNGPTATDVIAAVLATSSKWIAPAGQTTVSIGGTPLSVKSSSRFTGEIHTDLSEAPSNSVLAITRTQNAPAWGAVMSRATRPMRNIKSAGSDEVTIEKRMLLADSTGWKETSTLHPGEKVRIELLIKTTRPMDYVTITDERAACLEPVDQLPGTIFSEGALFYRENRDSQTNLFIDYLPAGTYLLTYDMWVNNSGEFASGIATIQSQIAPALTAHSSGTVLRVR